MPLAGITPVQKRLLLTPYARGGGNQVSRGFPANANSWVLPWLSKDQFSVRFWCLFSILLPEDQFRSGQLLTGAGRHLDIDGTMADHQSKPLGWHERGERNHMLGGMLFLHLLLQLVRRWLLPVLLAQK